MLKMIPKDSPSESDRGIITVGDGEGPWESRAGAAGLSELTLN